MNQLHVVPWCNVNSWPHRRTPAPLNHHRSLRPTFTHTAIKSAISHCRTWRRWSNRPDGHEHAGQLNPPTVRSASSVGTEPESILCCSSLLLLLQQRPISNSNILFHAVKLCFNITVFDSRLLVPGEPLLLFLLFYILFDKRPIAAMSPIPKFPIRLSRTSKRNVTMLFDSLSMKQHGLIFVYSCHVAPAFNSNAGTFPSDQNASQQLTLNLKKTLSLIRKNATQ